MIQMRRHEATECFVVMAALMTAAVDRDSEGTFQSV